MKKRITIHLLTALNLVGLVLHAAGDGGQAGAFMRYGVGVRAMGLGRAFVAVADDASSVYWNPAGLLGVERPEVMSMYSNLYYDSRYAYLGITVPRMLESSEKRWLNWLLGPGTAFGMGWIGMSMVGFEQRTQYNEYLGQFDMGENGWLLSWARETVGLYGVFRYGLTYKMVSQQFSGLQNGAMNLENTGSDWSGGLDVGFTFRPIHAPVFRVAVLKYLLPLQLGLTVQNLITPGWEKSDGGRQTFPRIIRYGLGYRVILRDWMPEAWNIKSGLGETALLIAIDEEHYSGAQNGTYFGLEGQIPVNPLNVWLYPRMGLNNRTEGLALGFGMSMPFKSSALKLDYVHTSHPDLAGDTRFCVSVQFNPRRDAAFFREKAQSALLSGEMKKYNHLVLTKYPNEFVSDAAADIAPTVDRNYKKRLYALIGGIRYAELLIEDARMHLKNMEIGAARKKADEAATVYQENYDRGGEYNLTDEQTMDFGEVLIISNQMERAVNALEAIDENARTLRSYYLLGVANLGNNQPDQAEIAFNRAVKVVQAGLVSREMSMVVLSNLGWAEAMIQQGKYPTAIEALATLINFNRDQPLDENYPRYPVIRDDYVDGAYVVDDAMYLMGIAEILNKRYAEGLATLHEVYRKYLDLEYGILIDQYLEKLNAMEKRLLENDTQVISELESMAQDFLLEFFWQHNPSNKQFE
jgi:tetratricopeptide (TPR) repeat protein